MYLQLKSGAISMTRQQQLLVPVLGKDAQINLRDKLFKTPLMIACTMGNFQLVKMMVEAGYVWLSREPTNWWGSAKRDDTHLRATVVYKTCHHLFR